MTPTGLTDHKQITDDLGNWGGRNREPPAVDKQGQMSARREVVNHRTDEVPHVLVVDEGQEVARLR